MSKILVVTDIEKGTISRSTLEQLAFAKKSGLPADAVIIGKGVTSLADICAGHGAETVFVCDSPDVEHFLNDSWSTVVVEAQRQSGADIVLLHASELGRALAPKVAARLEAGVANDCAEVMIDSETVTVARPAMATKLREILRFKSTVKVISVQSGLTDIDAGAQPEAANTVTIAAPAPDPRNRLIEVQVKKSERVDLEDAKVVISVGRGAQKKIKDITTLADKIGAAIGATRPVINAGILPYNLQVGQTGRTVHPDLYIALGISGAILHVSGMAKSKCIIAVNKDPEAPIFKVADYGIVGDVRDVLPVFMDKLVKLFNYNNSPN